MYFLPSLSCVELFQFSNLAIRWTAIIIGPSRYLVLYLKSSKKLLRKIISHLLANDLLYVHQYGFLPNRSTEHNLLQILNHITKTLDEGNFCIGVFLDLRKAFDVCSHDILLKKLQKMGIRGNAYTVTGLRTI